MKYVRRQHIAIIKFLTRGIIFSGLINILQRYFDPSFNISNGLCIISNWSQYRLGIDGGRGQGNREFRINQGTGRCVKMYFY